MIKTAIIKKLKSGKYRLYSKERGPDGKRKNLGTYDSLSGAKKREEEVRYFKHNAEDGEADDKQSKLLGKVSDVAQYLEEAGYIDEADKVYMVMNAIDSDIEEDYLIDMFITTDEERNVGGGTGYIPGSAGGGAPGLFAVDEAQKMASMADKLDQKGLYEEADAIDDVLKDVIEELEMSQKKREKSTTKKETEEEKQEEGAIARSNGLTDGNTNMFQGLTDSWFYKMPYGSE